jgi:hypothetical protein
MRPISLRNCAAGLLAGGACDASTTESGIFKICLFALADESLLEIIVRDYLKPLLVGLLCIPHRVVNLSRLD